MARKIGSSRVFWYALGFSVLLLVIYLFYLNHVIVERFEQRRWALPSRVYSDTYPIHNGRFVTMAEIISRVSHLGYRKVSGVPRHHGEYAVDGANIKIFLHDFDYPLEAFKGLAITFDIEDHRVTGLREVEGGKDLSLMNLEPELIGSIFDENLEDRTFVRLDQIPRVLTEAVVIIEDERYYRHQGVDPIGIMRAFGANVFSGRIVQGGSTLTQQMVKNFFLTHERTLTRKVNEVLMAMLIERHFSKNEILEVYLNEIYFGQRGNISVTGVQEAARFYFSKDVSQLLPDEAALLAAIIKSPGLYSPFVNSEQARGRRDLVLGRLFAHQVIDKKTYDTALSRALPQRPNVAFTARPFHFIDFVKQQLREGFPQEILESAGHRIFTTLDMFHQRAAEEAIRKKLELLESQRPFLKKNLENGLTLEGALIAVQPKTGFIRAYVGGRDYTKSQFDVISLGRRQPGSTFKPFVYLSALDPRVTDPPFTLASLINDEPLTVRTGAGPWQPENYDQRFHGRVRLREALEKSYNVATVWLGEQVGLENIVEIVSLAGMKAVKPFPSLVLGAFEVTPLELTEAYTIFPNNGIRSRPMAIRRVVTADGEVLEKKSFEMKRVVSHDAASLINQALKGVLDRGTGHAARALGFYKRAAGKTGTTSGYKDSWFAGYTPDLLAVVWVGYKDNQTTNLSGASGALPIWTDYMKGVAELEPDGEFVPGENIVIAPIDTETGGLYVDRCRGGMIEEYFIDGTVPLNECQGF